MKKTIIYALIITLSVTACTKQENVKNIELPPRSQAAQKTSTSNGWTEYRIATLYENSYAHWCQLWASPLSAYEKQNACAPSAYMIAAHMVAVANSYTFMPCSGSKLRNICDRIGSLPLNIGQITSYVSSYDSPPLIAISYHTSSRNEFKEFLLSHLTNGDPIIVPVVISQNSTLCDHPRYYSENTSDNYDIDSSPQSGRPNYILTSKLSGGWGHFVVVTRIRIYNTTGNGLIYYKDPLSQTGTTKVCSFTRFLESAKINGDCTEPYCINYDAVVIKKSGISSPPS